MSYTPRARDRYKVVAALTTGLVAFGTATATGVTTGLAAHATAAREQARRHAESEVAAQAYAAYRRQVQGVPANRTVIVTRVRPTRVVVHTRVVHRSGAAGVAQVGGGSAVTAPPVRSGGGGTAGSSGGSSGSGGSGGGAASVPAPAPAPPPPPPPPAPSTGS